MMTTASTSEQDARTAGSANSEEGGAAQTHGAAGSVASGKRRVSVVIPTFNRADLLGTALASVLKQSYPAYEIVVVDDCSTDGTRQVVEAFRDGRIRYIRHERNRGGSAARNTGIRAAIGDYIAFLDDDDEWEPNKIEVQLRALENWDAVLCTSNVVHGGLRRYRDRKQVTLEDLRRGEFTSGGTGVLMARADMLKETMFDEELPRYQDWDLFIRLAKVCRIGYLNEPLVRYNGGGHARITNRIANLPIAELERWLRMVEKHQEFFGPKWFRRHMCRAMLFGLKHRNDRLRHLRGVATRYGPLTVGWALQRRVAQKLSEKWLDRFESGVGQRNGQEQERVG